MNDEELIDDLGELEIDSLGDEQEFLDTEEYQNINDTEEPSDLILTLLRDRGIEDTNSIKFEDEDGYIRERAWEDLSLEEQRSILNQSYDYDPETEPDDEEVDFLNYLRDNNITPSQYVLMINNNAQLAVQLAYQSALENNNTASYTVDDFSDEELFVLDLQAKSLDITDDEALLALYTALQNPEVWKKLMEGIRNEYKTLEDNKVEEERLQREEQEQLLLNLVSNSILNEIENLTSFGDLDIALELEDKEELAEFILDKDEYGISPLGRVLNDPLALVLMAWFALHGEDTFNEINRYMGELLRHSTQLAYQKGLQDARGGGRMTIRAKKNNQGDSLDDITF